MLRSSTLSIKLLRVAFEKISYLTRSLYRCLSAALLFIVPRSPNRIPTAIFVRPSSSAQLNNISSTEQFQNTAMRDAIESRRLDNTLKYLASGTDVRVISRVMQMSSFPNPLCSYRGSCSLNRQSNATSPFPLLTRAGIIP